MCPINYISINCSQNSRSIFFCEHYKALQFKSLRLGMTSSPFISARLFTHFTISCSLNLTMVYTLTHTPNALNNTLYNTYLANIVTSFHL